MKTKKIQKLTNEAEVIIKQFEACQTYKRSKNILQEAKRSIEFYEDRQWGENKKKIPFDRPSANVIGNIIDGKVASVNQKTFKIEFVVDDDQASTNKVTKFAEFQMKELNQNELNLQACYEAYIKGTWCWYFYWDEDAMGTMGKVDGALKCTIVDIQDFAVANPNERDIEKQDWIIIRSRESVKAVKEMCDTLDDEEKEKYITHNEYDSAYVNDIEQGYEKMCDSYLKMFKQNGEVYFTKCTQDILYQKPTALSPLINEEVITKTREQVKKEESSSGVEESSFENDSVSKESMKIDKEDKQSEFELREQKYKANVYPIIIDSFLRRDNSIFGRSLVHSMIPMQKIINQCITTQTLGAVKEIMPTLIVKQGALGTANPDLTKPGGILVDRSVGQNGFGITTLQTGTLSTVQFQLAQNMIALTKDIHRASEILDDGRAISQNLSGYAMSQLQTIQDKPVAQHQEILSRAIAREGRILEMFYKLFYVDKTFSYEFTDAELLKANPNADVTDLARTTTDIFNGVDYLDTPFNITVEVGETAKQSELMLTSTLETLFLNGTISKLSPEDLMMWAEMIPNYAFPKKNEFKMLLKQKQNSIIAQLQQQNQQLVAQLEQAGLQNQAMQQEFTNKINEQNEILRNQQLDLKALQVRERNTERNQKSTQGKSR